MGIGAREGLSGSGTRAQPSAPRPRRAVRTAPGPEQGPGPSHCQVPAISLLHLLDEAKSGFGAASVGAISPGARLCSSSLPRI